MRWLSATIPHSLLTAFLLLHLCLPVTPSARAQGITPTSVITTVAGTDWVFRDDGRPATAASLGAVWGVAVDAGGNVFAADIENRLVVKFSPGGVLTVVAGNGLYGYSGDGGRATDASIAEPYDVAVDASGNVYIADTGNYRVRKVTPNGVITTVAGNGEAGFSGDGGPATSASLFRPEGIAVDADGNLYISDTANNRVRRVTPAGVITTIAGTGEAGFSGDGGSASQAQVSQPLGLALDSSGNLYIADGDNNRIRRVSPAGTITTVAGGGDTVNDGAPATEAGLSFPSDVAVDAAGNIYIADHFLSRIRKVNFLGTITTLAGREEYGFSGDGGPAVEARLNNPAGVALGPAGNVYFSDSRNRRVRRVNSDGIIATVAGSGDFKFSGDGGPATSAALNFPFSVNVDALGNLYIADSGNNRVRKVGANGTITTVAGNGTEGFTGDGGPATSASLSDPRGVAVDGNGNLYIADSGNQRVRKVSPSGIITTIAGGGFDTGDGIPATSASLDSPLGIAVDVPGNVYFATGRRVYKVNFAGTISTLAGTGEDGFSGDGGPATNAMLNFARDVAVDADGTVYIADTDNHRIRQVSSAGIITTVAGNGTEGFSGDGGQAASASLNTPYGVTVDAAGNLLIVDTYNSVMRRVDSDGVIRTVAGGGEESGDGRPATEVNLDFILDAAVDGSGNLYIADNGGERIRKVLASAPTLTVAPATLSFSVPAGVERLDSQQIIISSNAFGLLWSAQESTESGGGWLALAPASGFAPGGLGVFVNASGLAPGNYRGAVRVQSPVATPASLSITVDLTVTASSASQLAVEPVTLTFETPAGGNPPARTLRINNAGGGSLEWTARAETASGGNWLSVAPASGSASGSASGQVEVTASSSALAPGVYSGAVIVASATTNETLRVPVSLLVSESRQTILLSQAGLLFTAVEGGAVIPPQTFGVLNTGQGVMNWTAQASTLSGGNWLTVSPGEGASEAASLEVPLVEVGVNVTGLAEGQYSGLVRLNAPTADNSPQFVTVELNVLPRGSNPGPLVRPTGLIFAAQTGAFSPGSQTLNLGTVTPGTVDVVSGLLTSNGGNWLEAVPRNLALASGEANQRIVVQPTLGSLDPGVYRGALTLLFGDGSPAQVVNILFLVVRQTGSVTPARGAAAGLLEPQSHSACVPTQLFATHRTLGTSFASPVGWPSTIEAQVADDCGHAVPDATVVARFSNGDPQIVLNGLRNGLYLGTWRPATPAAQVTVTVRAELPPLAPVEVRAQGSATANAAVPAVFAGGIVNTASYGSGEGLAPGSIVSVFGRNLARGENLAPSLPLQTDLGGVRLNVGGVEVPLFYASDGQINAQLPFNLAPNTRQTVVVRTTRENGAQAYAVPEIVTVTSARPAIFTVNQQGSGQGAILNQDSSANSDSNPAARSSVVQIFATGLGTTIPVVPSGQPAPGEPPALVTTDVEARIGGQPATVQFAGLAPGFAGLYQVNVLVPANIEPGPEVELSLIQNGVPSNTVTLAVQ